MKIDLTVIAAMFDEVLQRTLDGRSGPVPYQRVVWQWAEINLRTSDLSRAIEQRNLQGQIRLEARHDGLWIHHYQHLHPAPALRHRPRLLMRRLLLGLALEQVRERRDSFYAGYDRRRIG